jgi:hypothetical protein
MGMLGAAIGDTDHYEELVSSKPRLCLQGELYLTIDELVLTIDLLFLCKDYCLIYPVETNFLRFHFDKYTTSPCSTLHTLL